MGDVGDFGKYALLKQLSTDDRGAAIFKLGVVWYLVPNDGGNDGKHTRYLDRSKSRNRRFRECAPGIYDALDTIVNVRRHRHVAEIREAGILPGAVFFEHALSFDQIPSFQREVRQKHRSNWIAAAVESTKHCELIFVDPDNGLQCGVRRHEAKGPKYVFYDELTPYLDRDQSLVVYHHLGHHASHDEQIIQKRSELRENLQFAGSVISLRYRRGTSRAFFIVPSPRHRDRIEKRVRDILASPWGERRRFELVP